MNERIRELMAQAVTFYLDPDSNAYEAQVSPENMERFAELIVQDCIAQVALLGISNFENDDISWTVDMAIKNIQHRFGFEK